MTTQLGGMDKVLGRLRELAERVPGAAAQGLFALGNNIMTEAKERAPHDLGTLAGSGYVTPPEMYRGTPVVEVGFGGPSASYVVRQHEDTALRHTNGREAKFLEKALDAHAASAAPLIAGRCKRALAGATTRIMGKVHPSTPDEGGPA